MRPVLVAPVDERHGLRAVPQLLRPVEGRIAAADDDDALIPELLGVRHTIEDSAAVPRLGAGLGQAPWRESTDSARDDDRARRKAVGLGDENVVVVVPLE